jgi:hypothetical protein
MLMPGMTLLLVLAAASTGSAQATCPNGGNTVIADVVVFDTPIMFNRLGAQNPNWVTYALRRDTVNIDSDLTLVNGGAAVPGRVAMRKDKRIRPLVLRVNEGDCLRVNFQNLLAPVANPFVNAEREPVMNAASPFLRIDDQVAGRFAGFHVRGLQLVGGIGSDASNVGRNTSSLVAPGAPATTYTYYAPDGSRGAYLADSYGATFGGEATAGNIGQGMFAAVNVEPKGAVWYRSQVTEEELRLARVGSTPAPLNQPIINYEARYPGTGVWVVEGKANLPILNMRDGNNIVHSDLNAIIAYGGSNDGSFPVSTYPLESAGKRNPAIPNRLEPFREFTVIFHDEASVGQAFPGFFNANPVSSRILHGVRDTFMINYGVGGVGAEIVANRLGVGPMWDCLTCSYEEFFLASSAVGDPAMVVDIPANIGLEACDIGLNPNVCADTGPKALKALFPDDPSNVHHSYQSDRVVFRNLHAGAEHHIFHLHNHQWLFDPNDDNANYLDAQAVGPGSGYTYEINFGGSGNRNKTAGDAIFHCHFYPHFAQGMWELWRIHDVYETGTPLVVSGAVGSGIHTVPFALFDGTPALHPLAGTPDLPDLNSRARALPDGEIIDGTPIPAVVPLPGKAMPLMPGDVAVIPKNANPGVEDIPGIELDESSQAYVIERTKNPGFPFWIAGVDCGDPECYWGTVGQRPPTPPLDMLTEEQAAALRNSTNSEIRALFGPLNSLTGNQNGGWDGGLPRHALDGFAAVGGRIITGPDPVFRQEQSKFSFDKEIFKARPIWYDEEGTDLEQLAMAFHKQREHPSRALLLNGTTTPANYVTNGGPPQAGAPFFEPCIDDEGTLLGNNVIGKWFSAQPGGLVTLGLSPHNAVSPRVYKGANIQIDAVFNKLGQHYPQQRIVSLWEDVVPFITKKKPPEPFVIRNNTLDCTRYLHTNLVPRRFEVDDYEVTTPTDIIGQHIHLPKWDLPSADGSGNGWNYEDGTLSPGSVQERIHAINHYNGTRPLAPGETNRHAGNPANSSGAGAGAELRPLAHPYFGIGVRNEYLGARTTIQRWMFDPVLNIHSEDRGLGIIFTHDHYGPSTVQQVGLYGTVLAEPMGSRWVHNETGRPMATRPDGGPTDWQAAILPGPGGVQFQPFREFWFQHSDFQSAYDAGVYIGAGPDGRPNGVQPTANSFRSAINPSVRKFSNPVFPDVIRHEPTCLDGNPRPCPEAISADDPGFFVTNYRNEPLGWRIYDPNKLGPDGKPGTQADGLAGDMAYALHSRADRKVPQLNTRLGNTPYPALSADIRNGDPFTPMLRAYAGDLIRIKSQAGGDEAEHNFSINGVKWLQGGSAHGRAPNSGWRNSQHRGISEQFAFAAPVVPVVGSPGAAADHAYSTSNGGDGWWSGVWGILRAYNTPRKDLFALPTTEVPLNISNPNEFDGACPRTAPIRAFDITAVLANDVLGNAVGAVIPSNVNPTDNVGGTLNPQGGTLVYNPRPTALSNGKSGPLHDPTAMLYVATSDLIFAPGTKTALGNPTALRPGAPVEPVVVRANAGECIQVTLRNALLDQAVHANGSVIDASGRPVFENSGQALFVAAAAGASLCGTQRCTAVPAAQVTFDKVPDLAGYTMYIPIVARDKNNPQGVTWFGSNLVRPSTYVGLHPQLVTYDVVRDDGMLVGQNPPGQALVPPGGSKTSRWYAGDLMPIRTKKGKVDLVATPIEFGGANLMPADILKQAQKGLIGALSIGPQGASIVQNDTAWDHQQVNPAIRRESRASATLNGTIRDFTVVFQQGFNPRYGDGTAVEHVNAAEEPPGVVARAVNYGTEPMWFRFGLRPDALLGNASTAGSFGAVPNPEMAYSNSLVNGDPATPVFTASAGAPVRMHVLYPAGTSVDDFHDRGIVFHLHGHMWQRAPYVCPGQNDGLSGLTGKCNWTNFGTAPFEVGSRAIGVNPIGMYMGAQESVLPGAHFDIVLPGNGTAHGGAGGRARVTGDFLFRDQGALGNTQGLWGIFRVE